MFDTKSYQSCNETVARGPQVNAHAQKTSCHSFMYAKNELRYYMLKNPNLHCCGLFIVWSYEFRKTH